MSEITTMTDLMGEVVTLREQLVEVRTELASYAWTVTPARVQAQLDQLRQQLATTHEHLESQRRVTYEAIEREHAAKQQLAEANKRSPGPVGVSVQKGDV